MKRTLLALALATAATTPLTAQSDADKLVARVNGREFTNAHVQALWDAVPANLQDQYLRVGGKKVFFENYLAKYLIIQEAHKSGFAEQIGAPAELDEKGEALLFDRYVREIIAAPLISEADMKRVYEENRSDFAMPEQGRYRIIRALKNDKPELAREAMSKIMVEIFSARTALAKQVGAENLIEAMTAKFAEVAARESDHPSAADGGDVGYVPLHTVDPKIADGIRSSKTGTISGIIETPDAFQMILVEDHRAAGVESYEAAEGAIRNFLMAREAKKVMALVAQKSAELRKSNSVELFLENLR